MSDYFTSSFKIKDDHHQRCIAINDSIFLFKSMELTDIYSYFHSYIIMYTFKFELKTKINASTSHTQRKIFHYHKTFKLRM